MFVVKNESRQSKERLCCLFNGSDHGSAKSAGIIEPGSPLRGILFTEENCENRARTQHRTNMGAIP
jgi:hypothetical protein